MRVMSLPVLQHSSRSRAAGSRFSVSDPISAPSTSTGRRLTAMYELPPGHDCRGLGIAGAWPASRRYATVWKGRIMRASTLPSNSEFFFEGALSPIAP